VSQPARVTPRGRGTGPEPGTSGVPDGYAMVMATGVVSIAADDQHYPALGLPFGVLAGAVFVLVTVAAVERVWRTRHRPAGLPRRPDRVLRWFSLAAACAVLAARWRTGPWPLVWTLSIASAAAWAVLIWPALVTLGTRSIAELREWARGNWLLASVACQSQAVTAADLAHGAAARPLLDLALACWLLGLISYLALATLITARAITDRRLLVAPDAWILMGALAIATLAASTITTAGRARRHDWTAALTHPAAPLLWALASAWIPVLAAAQARYLPRALCSHPARWAAVFPLGMYSVATAALAPQLHVSALRCIALVSFWIALTACSVSTAAGVRRSNEIVSRITI
jgi:tellurite resistance protein TehA-like permease